MSTDDRQVVELARRLRQRCLQMVHRARASHIGGCLSAADLMANLYGWFLRFRPDQPDWPERDLFLLSKGHAAAVLYAALAEAGFFPEEWLERYCQNGAELAGHVTRDGVPGVEVSTGSLGHGLSLGVGMALARKRDGHPGRVVVMLSDGECDEGATWEAAMLAPHLELDNLLAVVDHNQIQSLGHVREVLPLEPFQAKWESFRWSCRTLDGHDHGQIRSALEAFPFRPGTPSVILAETVKGKGVSFMEDQLLWHYRSPDDHELALALAELDGTRSQGA